MIADFTLRSLSSKFISYDKLSADWKTYNKDAEKYIHRFISINKRAFDFLGVTATVSEQEYKKGLLLCSSQYVGAYTLLSPISGKPFYDLNVVPIYNEDIGDIISLLGENLKIEYASGKLLKPLKFKVPIYFACVEYMIAFNEALKQSWTKFDTRTYIENIPSSSTDWVSYAQKSYMPENKLLYANTRSYHTPYHHQWLQLTGLLENVINTYISSNPPVSIRNTCASLIERLREYVRSHPKTDMVGIITDNPSDPPAIKNLKLCAGKYIEHHYQSQRPWRIEIGTLFERFVQYIVEEAAKRGGWKCRCNEHFVINNPSGIRWMLRYIEPDIILTRDSDQWIIDAKYKSHVYNIASVNNEQLKDVFREDYHQVLAYTSFSTTSRRRSMIIYPSKKLITHRVTVKSRISMVYIDTNIIGLPFTTASIEESIETIAELLNM